MKISTKSRYALRIMIFLAENYPLGPIPIKDIADNNFSLSIPLYVKPIVDESTVDTRTVQEHYDSWMAATEMMKLSYEKLNALLGKEAETDE